MSQVPDFNKISPEAKKDIEELKRRIGDYKTGREDEERFKLYRLTRGVYGQRQFGVQMFRTKIPFGKLTTEQLVAIANAAEKYTNGNLHITTRQNIQMHYVKLDDSPAVWSDLASYNVTAREACGNTVRNITASAKAGIDPNEPFDVSPYAQAAFEYFLRNPICQDMGRKIKPAFSSSEQDSAFTYFHDFGFIPRVRQENGEERRGFKLIVGGGLGAVSIVGHTVYEFLEEEKIIPFMEAAIRVFDRYGEREKRMKARMKYLVQKLGIEEFLRLVEEERKGIKNQEYWIDANAVPTGQPKEEQAIFEATPHNTVRYENWRRTNVFEQKQEGWFGVQVRVYLGNIQAEKARKFAALVQTVAADDIRLTVNQGMLLRFVREDNLPYLFNELEKLGLAEAGFDSIMDITACPGTDTCALGVTNSTGLSGELEKILEQEYPELIDERNIKIKISGCMNSCGQHMAASIGFHGSSIKKRPLVIPAMQVVLGGGVDPQGKGFVAEKVIKVPTKKVPDVVRYLLDEYLEKATEGEYFNDFYYRNGKKYFYDLLKPLAQIDSLEGADFFDWGQDHAYKQEIGVGECAGVTLDVVGTIIQDAFDKVELSKEAYVGKAYADSIYHSYTAFVIGAKALLLSADVKCNTHKGILSDFQTHYINAGKIVFEENFERYVLSMKKQTPSEEFAKQYSTAAKAFVQEVIAIREGQLAETGQEKLVISNYYKA